MPKRNKPPPKRQGSLYEYGGTYKRPLFRLLFEHQRWLNSEGRFGERLDGMEFWFKDCDLDGVDFTEAGLLYATFEGGSVRGARFVGAELYWAKFEACDVARADFSKADLTWAIFLTNHEEARFDNAKCDHMAFSLEAQERNYQLDRTLRLSGFGLIRPPAKPGPKKYGPSPR
jgi:hypothetical protein